MQLSLEARKVLVDSYVTLRRGDTAPGSRVAYRMTVRQLEALIRLSEAIARSYLETLVSPFWNFCLNQVSILELFLRTAFTGSIASCAFSSDFTENVNNQASSQ